MTAHQFKRKRAPDGQTHVLAYGSTGPPATVAVCPTWEWARQVVLGLIIVQGAEAQRARRRAARIRKRKGAK